MDAADGFIEIDLAELLGAGDELIRVRAEEGDVSRLDDPRVASPFMEYAFYRIERSLDGSTPVLHSHISGVSRPVFVLSREQW